jgi:hypothetical protein
MSLLHTPATQLQGAPTVGARATVFGLDVHAESPLALLDGAAAQPTGRTLQLTVASEHELASRWPGSAELVCDQRERDGTASFRIEQHPTAGYLISGPAYGRHLLSPDGRHALCMPGDRPAEVWQRLLIAQVLPFAAVLHGLEVLHASAVVTERGAIALAGPSRAGKTSVALELCRRGARFLADDVLALQRAGETLLGQPGTPLAGLDHREARRLARQSPSDDHEIVAVNARERLVRMQGASQPAPLQALFFLDRRSDAPRAPVFEPAAVPELLLGSSFNSVITTPARLRGLLEVCAVVARGRVERIHAGPKLDAAQLAAAIQQRLRGAL